MLFLLVLQNGILDMYHVLFNGIMQCAGFVQSGCLGPAQRSHFLRIIRRSQQ